MWAGLDPDLEPGRCAALRGAAARGVGACRACLRAVRGALLADRTRIEIIIPFQVAGPRRGPGRPSNKWVSVVGVHRRAYYNVHYVTALTLAFETRRAEENKNEKAEKKSTAQCPRAPRACAPGRVSAQWPRASTKTGTWPAPGRRRGPAGSGPSPRVRDAVGSPGPAEGRARRPRSPPSPRSLGPNSNGWALARAAPRRAATTTCPCNTGLPASRSK